MKINIGLIRPNGTIVVYEDCKDVEILNSGKVIKFFSKVGDQIVSNLWFVTETEFPK